MDQSNFLNDILIVIVLYKKKLEQSAAFKAIETATEQYKSTTSIFIYDNSPNPLSVDVPNIIYRHDPKNNGVSKAYNGAFSVALTFHKKWMLLLDQDSELTLPTFYAFQTAIAAHPNLPLFAPTMKDGIGIVSPFRFRCGKGYRLAKVTPGKYALKNFKLINSGMLISTEAFRKSGGFDERFPLDLSDIVFLERLAAQYKEFYLIDAVCTHSLSVHDNTVSEALNRFIVFCQAMHDYKDLKKKNIWLKVILLSRSLKLFFRYGKFDFFKIAINRI